MESWMVWWDKDSSHDEECKSASDAWRLYNSIDSDHKAIMHHPDNNSSPTTLIAIGSYDWMNKEYKEES